MILVVAALVASQSGAAALIIALIGFLAYLVSLAAWLYIYFVGMATEGQTPGKRSQGVKVIKRDGTPLGLGGAIARWLVQALTNMVLYIGSLWMLFDEEQRTLYDKALDMDAVMVEPGSIFPLFPGGKPF